jgi:hypothetical protein
MTLAEFAASLGATPKWVLNAMSALEIPLVYTTRLGRQFATAREIMVEFDASLARAMLLAGCALALWNGQRTLVRVARSDDSDVAIELDVFRILSRFYTRLSAARSLQRERQRGRPVQRVVDPLQTARAWGLDLSLLQLNLTLTPAKRIAQHDAMTSFRQNVRRVAEHP